jgi:hypothetical protein
MGYIAQLALFVALFAASATAVAADPRIVLLERDPWRMVIGSDSPTFVLYSDGLAIFHASEPTKSPSGYLSTRLSKIQHEALISTISPEALGDLSASYMASYSTDQPRNELHVWVNGRRKSVSVYGALRRDPEARSRTPEQFLRAFDTITNFAPKAGPWIPELIEVLIWPYQYSPDEPLQWPHDWPTFDQARPRGREGLHQVFLEAKHFESLRQLVSSLKPKQAVRYGNRKWAISYRLPLPQEDSWAR